ncbi:MAG: Flp pilus assembly complex ATPase component TadA [Deltaproteobacteria bacterium]|nr:Flp pilus assembly complex ATPase component TadA [Candidatus Anaeroferrophillus wilburensis]MBN2889442.1 Flp pilus assembly complex ATPase component TadA [Deltaproteobacteria bacterium]
MAFTTRKRLGDVLLDEGLITNVQLLEGLEKSKRENIRLGQSLMNLGFATEEQIIKAIAKQLNISHMTFDSFLIDPEVVSALPEMLARKYKAIPLFKVEDQLTLAMVDPMDIISLDEIASATSCQVNPVIAAEGVIVDAIEKYYGRGSSLSQVYDSLQQGQGERGRGSQPPTLGEIAKDDGKVSDFINALLIEAVKVKASDIHLEPEKELLRIRFRVDGLMREKMTTPIELHANAVSRLKIMADLNIAERRLPQDGRFQLAVGNKNIDVRMSTIPTVRGEKVVLRLLDQSALLVDLEQLGFLDEQEKLFREKIAKPYGMVIITGPTGSGKTTTLYAALNSINSLDKNIVTLEDPVEYQLPIINQIQVNPKINLTFASGLRSILRQDPDVIMVGEIRDQETAEMAIQSALTGHLVFSTLHTNDAPGCATRLLDMGIQPFLVASSLILVVGQRLARRLCPHCKESYVPSQALVDTLALEGTPEFYHAPGCPRCSQTGYAGRLAFYEVMSLSPAIKELIVSRAHSELIQEAACREGFQPLREVGLQHALAGETTIEEVLRVTMEVE